MGFQKISSHVRSSRSFANYLFMFLLLTVASPNHVLLSSPYIRNPSYGAQQIQTLPLENSNSRKRNNGDKAKSEKRKVRALDRPSPAESSLSPSLSGSDGGSHSRSTDTRPEENSSPPTARSGSGSSSRGGGGGRGRKPPHELLTEDQKKANHIASEQKRRANIRVGFDQLVDIVPTLSHCHRSESLILQKSADYIRQLIEVKNGLRDRARELQTALGEAPDEDSSEGEVDYAF
ncbi:hypothetical protein J3Q64DRAFT_1728004 [Phycomyces blakesleeanus]|uniref:BHLH domain-containing protein n=1 Tax=Phycomyces blakesleeanus TaxID=4837 RepID=A0ABR3B443_PHYBL